MHKNPYAKSGTGKRANLVRARLANGMSQQAVADQIGCSRELYSQIENGIRDGRTIGAPDKLETLFDIPKDYLMKEFPDNETFTDHIMRRFMEVQ